MLITCLTTLHWIFDASIVRIQLKMNGSDVLETILCVLIFLFRHFIGLFTC